MVGGGPNYIKGGKRSPSAAWVNGRHLGSFTWRKRRKGSGGSQSERDETEGPSIRMGIYQGERLKLKKKV